MDLNLCGRGQEDRLLDLLLKLFWFGIKGASWQPTNASPNQLTAYFSKSASMNFMYEVLSQKSPRQLNKACTFRMGWDYATSAQIWSLTGFQNDVIGGGG